MSRIGKLPVNMDTAKVTVTGDRVQVSGSLGELFLDIPKGVEAKVEGTQVLIDSEASNMRGLVRSLINNMIIGVTKGWTRVLELSGTGYRANTTGSVLNLALGFSHPVVINAPAGIKFTVVENKITVSGADKTMVGQVAAQIRSLKPADPYKAKGFKYDNEVIIKKPGKAAKAGATTAK